MALSGKALSAAHTFGARNSMAREEDGGAVSLLGRLISKEFDSGMWYGFVEDYFVPQRWYRVTYADGDAEEVSWSEVAPTLLERGSRAEA